MFLIKAWFLDFAYFRAVGVIVSSNLNIDVDWLVLVKYLSLCLVYATIAISQSRTASRR